MLQCGLGLNAVADDIQMLNPYPSSVITVVDRQLHYITHSNRDYIMKESLTSKADYAADTTIMNSIKLHRRSVESYDSDHGTMYIYHATEKKTGWTVILQVPGEEMMDNFYDLFIALTLIMIVCVTGLISVSWFLISRMTRPLENFGKAARQISHGDFNVQLPVITEHNELYDLRQALASMKQSLDQYIHDLETTMKSKAAIENELNVARNIQMSMVPNIFPPYPDRKEIDIHASLTPAKAVGGDLYDFYLDGDDLYFCIGDVSGKGVPASLFMAITHSLFQNIVLREKTPAKIAMALNNALAQDNEESMFVTMIIGKLNLATGTFTGCNCGHNAPVTNGDLDRKAMHVTPSAEAHYMSMLPTNIPVGIMEDFEYEEVTISVEEDVALLLYTDGVNEAKNKDKVLYGNDRLSECVKSCGKGAGAKTIVNAIEDDVSRHAQGAEQSDDITILCLRYKK